MTRLHWICLALVPYLVLAVLATSLSVSEIQATGKVLFRALRDSECKVKCKSRKPRIMCGSDGVSYLSKCEVKRARRCEGKNVDILRKGKCSEKDIPMTKCFQEREQAKSTGKPGDKDGFIPECNSDGTFATVQCHVSSGYCWCVSKEGKPQPNTSSKSRKPNCNPKSKKNIQPRPDKNNKNRPNKDRPNTNRPNRKRKRCTSEERDKFNSNLVKVFTEEYNRSMMTFPDSKSNSQRKEKLEKLVVDWKFEYYDANSDKVLQRKEVNALRRLVKKFIKPRSCAKTFLKYCDFDRNKLINPREWAQCLGVDSGSDQNTTPEPEKPKEKAGEIERPEFPSLQIDKDPPWTRPGRDPLPKQKNDCVGDKMAALEQEQDNPEGGIFIPSCTPEGKWMRAQCHKSTGYCWCVEEVTGRPIRGTSTHGVEPKCDFDEGERPIPDCSFAEKQSFLANLLQTLAIEMAEHAKDNSTAVNALLNDPDQGIHEKAVNWKFAVIDIDFSQDLQDGELDAVKESIKRAKTKATRKCARRFIRYCDADGDKVVSQQEWVECLGVTKNVSLNLPSNPKRKGKNPFDTFLRDS